MKTQNNLSAFIKTIKLNEPISFNNLTVYPIDVPVDYLENFISLDDAIKNNWIDITEISEGGSVGNLKVKNNAPCSVLMLDGEELVGAKQNRILNTSILIENEKEIIIPVSCVEEGRWQYRSRNFRTSDAVFFSYGRKNKMRDVNMYSEKTGEFRSEQHNVWEDVAFMRKKSKAKGNTGAMRDVFEDKKMDIDSYLNNIPFNKEQNGMLVFINGCLMGCDIITNKKVFESYYRKILRSYAIDAIYSESKEKTDIPSEKQIEDFWVKASIVDTFPIKSLGLGYDWRITDKDIIGSALVVEDKLVNVTLFPWN